MENRKLKKIMAEVVKWLIRNERIFLRLVHTPQLIFFYSLIVGNRQDEIVGTAKK